MRMLEQLALILTSWYSTWMFWGYLGENSAWGCVSGDQRERQIPEGKMSQKQGQKHPGE